VICTSIYISQVLFKNIRPNKNNGSFITEPKFRTAGFGRWVNYVASCVDRLVFLIPPDFSTLASGNNGSESVAIFCGRS
jgi:hypothetical protein